MRACATANVLALAGSLAAAAVAACTGGSPPPVPPSAAADGPSTGAAAEPAPPLPRPAASASAAAPAASGPADAGAPRPRVPATARDCRDLAADITNEPPDRGVVMNNALTAADAGASDRLRPIIDVLKAKRDAFRCCFDLWAKGHPGEAGRVTLRLDLAADGKLEKADVKRDESTVRDDDLDACMVDVAKSLAYPRSPSGKRTDVTYPFEFKARR